MGIVSSLQAANLEVRDALENLSSVQQHPYYPLLFDPQTAGGLLVGLPPEQASNCVDALHQQGYAEAAIIGQVLAPAKSPLEVTVYVQ